MDAPAHVDPVERARALTDLVRSCADEAEREYKLPDRLASTMAAAGLYRLAAPAAVGGGEAHPFDQIRTIEAVSEIDGAAGWNLMIGIEVLGFLASALEPEVARKLLADPELIVAGAINPLGRAVRVEGGFRVSGQWPFCSGCQNSQYFWGQCVVTDDPEASPDPHILRLREALVPRSDFEIIENWNVSGLRGSGSHDVRIDDVFVPDERMTATLASPPRTDGTLFRMPPFTRLAYNKVGVATGIARGALEHFKAHASATTPRASAVPLRERVPAQLAVAEAEAALRSARAWVFEIISEIWDATEKRQPISTEQRALAQLACSNACMVAVGAVERLHAVAGSGVNFIDHPIERCFRDVHVVRQHIMVSPQWTEAAGRVLLGLDSRAPFF